MTPDPPLSVEFLAAWVNRHWWQKTHKHKRKRFEYRVTQKLLELMTERQVEGDLGKTKWQERVG